MRICFFDEKTLIIPHVKKVISASLKNNNLIIQNKLFFYNFTNVINNKEKFQALNQNFNT